MKIVESKDTKRFDIADYMKNFSRENQTRDRQTDSNSRKLTLEDLKNYRSKTSKIFIKDTSEENGLKMLKIG
jgi:hypothetical protein